MEDIVEVSKGGICWFEMSINRGAKGMELFVRAAPQIEAFMKNLGGEKEQVAMYGRDWIAVGGKDLEIYGIGKIGNGQTYALSRPAEGFDNPKDGRVNITFLRLVGISEPAGVRFLITEPVSKQYIKGISARLIGEVKNFVRDFIVPVTVNLRISSQDL